MLSRVQAMALGPLTCFLLFGAPEVRIEHRGFASGALNGLIARGLPEDAKVFVRAHESAERGTGWVDRPAFSPGGAEYTWPQHVSITCATPGATIHYTTDGTHPTESSPTYTGPVFVDQNLMLFARAYLEGWNSSPVSGASYVITGKVATPTLRPPAGTYTSVQNMTISCTNAGASIHYTTDGSNPTEGSPKYTDPILIDRSLVLKARAFAMGLNASPLKSAAYTMTDGRWANYTSGTEITALLDDDDFLWVGSYGGLARLDKATGNTTIYNAGNSGLPDNMVSSLARDLDGDLWIGTDNGLARFDGISWTVYIPTIRRSPRILRGEQTA